MSKKFNKSVSNLSEPGQGWTNGDLPPQLFAASHDGRQLLYGSQRRWIGLQSSWTRIGDGDPHDTRHSISSIGDSIHGSDEEEALAVRALIAQLCEMFYKHEWATGTGGGCSIRIGNGTEESPFRVFVAPSGIQKEDMIGNDIFELDMNRNVVVPPKTPNLKQSACTPLWYVVYKHRPSARCVIHTHSMNAVLATLLDEEAVSVKLTHLEMLKGVGHHAYDDILEIPVIDNRPTEDALAAQLEDAIQLYPHCNAVLVRRHGIYVWGDSWEQAKTQCESFDYLLETAIRMKQLGLDPAEKPTVGTYRIKEESDNGQPNKKQKVDGFHGMRAVDNDEDVASNRVPILPRNARVLLLDIEGCTSSISFVKEKLFPYVHKHLDDYLSNHYPKESDAYKMLCHSLQQEVQYSGGAHDPQFDAVDMVQWLMARDIKSPTLKDLQGQMWRDGYTCGELKGHVYPDVVGMLQWMSEHDVHVYIYSSGSVAAQKLLFEHSVRGDLLPYIKGHFDIPTAGNKKVASSYHTIAETLEVEPSSIVFVSDAEAELVAAKEAGIGWPVMSIRPGNATLTAKGKSFPAVYSLLQLCGE